jgi:hypothetical protein
MPTLDELTKPKKYKVKITQALMNELHGINAADYSLTELYRSLEAEAKSQGAELEIEMEL